MVNEKTEILFNIPFRTQFRLQSGCSAGARCSYFLTQKLSLQTNPLGQSALAQEIFILVQVCVDPTPAQSISLGQSAEVRQLLVSGFLELLPLEDWAALEDVAFFEDLAALEDAALFEDLADLEEGSFEDLFEGWTECGTAATNKG